MPYLLYMKMAARTHTTVTITRASNVKPTARPTLLPVAGALVGEPVVGFSVSCLVVGFVGSTVVVGGQIVVQLVREEVDMTGAPLVVLLRIVVAMAEAVKSTLCVETAAVISTLVAGLIYSLPDVEDGSTIAPVLWATVASTKKSSACRGTLVESGRLSEVSIECVEVVGSIGTTGELMGHTPIVVQPSAPTRSPVQESA